MKIELTKDEARLLQDMVLWEVGLAMAEGDKEKIDLFNSISNKLYKVLEKDGGEK